MVNITFHPTEGGSFYTYARATYNYLGFIKKNTVPATVYGLATYPIVRLSATDIAFGDQTVNTSQRQYVKMENIGNATLNISSITVPLDSDFSVEDDCGDYLAAGNYCGLLIYFEPTDVTDYVSTVDIVDDSYTSPEQISLSGSGIAAGSADINIEKTRINFGDKILDSVNTDTITLAISIKASIKAAFQSPPSHKPVISLNIAT